MNWIRKNGGWMTVVIIGLLPFIGVMDIFNIDFSGSGESWISIKTFTVPARRAGELPREVSGAHIAVKETGEWAIRWLVFVLSLTPFSILTGIKSRLYVRQAAGIIAFVYAGFHLVFFCIDRSLIETFKEFGYIMGFVATLIMLVLAVTSNRKSMKFLRKTWKKIHQTAYLAGLLAVLHVALLKHGDWIPYVIILVAGFLLRLSIVRQAISKLRIRKTLVSAAP
ncbi:ferric reductase-like transmembrane domain-containing protein [Gaoshiqia sp. Z1-71]|uniref:ferric reductase-like transmembrane domain-containing protein n=1 Tax=Gaoshiqia hydrogeniformans TaxID=3290090 RepID=UPI003BF79BA1